MIHRKEVELAIGAFFVTTERSEAGKFLVPFTNSL